MAVIKRASVASVLVLWPSQASWCPFNPDGSITTATSGQTTDCESGVEKYNVPVKYKFRIKFRHRVSIKKAWSLSEHFFSSCPLAKDLNSLLVPPWWEFLQETPKGRWSSKTVAFLGFFFMLVYAELNHNSLTEAFNTPNSSWSQASVPGEWFYTVTLDQDSCPWKEVCIPFQFSEGLKKCSWF